MKRERPRRQQGPAGFRQAVFAPGATRKPGASGCSVTCATRSWHVTQPAGAGGERSGSGETCDGADAPSVPAGRLRVHVLVDFPVTFHKPEVVDLHFAEDYIQNQVISILPDYAFSYKSLSTTAARCVPVWMSDASEDYVQAVVLMSEFTNSVYHSYPKSPNHKTSPRWEVL